MMQVGYPVMWFGKPEKAPAGLLPADGQLVNIADYQDLYDAYGVMYGGDGVTTFGMPDLRGYVIRGLDDGAGRDPDAANRTSRPDGVGGDNIGTTQGDEIKGHTHTGTTDQNGEHRHEFPSGAPGVAVAAGNIGVYNVKVSGETGDAGEHTHTFTTNTTGGLETRGKNIYAKIYIVAAPELTAGASGALTKIHTVNGLPPNTLGIDGDFAIDPTIARLYGPKSNGTWSSLTELQGSAGEDGNTILSGNNAPLNSLGVNGDFYFDLNNKDFYGPKSGNEWFDPISLTGDKGDKGEAFLIDAIDIIANRTSYDSESNGFIFYASDTGVAYQKEGSDPLGWLGPISLGGSVTSLNQNTFAGRVSSGNGTIEELSPVVARQILNIEDGATADQTGAEIKALYEAEANTNTLTDPLLNKLNSIDASHYGAPVQSTTDLAALSEGAISDKERRYVEDELSDYFYDSSALSGDIAPTDQTGGSGFWKKVAVGGESAASIKTKYESNADTNAFTDALASKVNGIEANATADQTDSEIVAAYNNVVSVVSSSEITLGTEASVRRFSPANIKSMIDTHSSGSSTSSAELLMMQLRLADLEGDAAILNDGIIDPFDDETDVDTASSSNQNWASASYTPSYSGSSDLVPTMTNYTTNGVTVSASNQSTSQNGHTFHTFDDNAGTQWVSGASGMNWILVDFGTPVDIAGYTVQRSIDSQATDTFGAFDLETSQDGINFTTVDSQSGLNWTSSDEVKQFDLTSVVTAQYARINNIVPLGGTGLWSKTRELQILSPANYQNMIIQSESFTADSTPDLARIFVQVESNENITLNTDIIVSASRDGGSNWVAGVLVDTGLSVNGVKLYDANGIDLSGQASSTDMKWKIETLNNKLMSIHGIGFKWS